MMALRLVGWLACSVALCSAAGALWIPAKAVLAQHLLESAWSRAQAGQTRALPWSWADTWPVARLSAPAHDVDHIVLAGATGRTLAFGPGHLMGSARPGASGRTVIAGHRDTHFAFLQSLRIGDELRLQTPQGERISYRVSGLDVVDSRAHRLSADPELPTLTLVTCWPFEVRGAGGPLRYVVEAEESSRAAR